MEGVGYEGWSFGFRVRGSRCMGVRVKAPQQRLIPAQYTHGRLNRVSRAPQWASRDAAAAVAARSSQRLRNWGGVEDGDGDGGEVGGEGHREGVLWHLTLHA